MLKTITADLAIAAAEKIGNCDFRTSVSCYTTGGPGDWIITVGENIWRRHLVVLPSDDNDVELAILSKDQSSLSVIDMLDTRKVEKTIRLSELTANGYEGVKSALCPA